MFDEIVTRPRAVKERQVVLEPSTNQQANQKTTEEGRQDHSPQARALGQARTGIAQIFEGASGRYA